MARVKLKWTENLTNATSKHLDWEELFGFFFYDVPDKASQALVADAQSEVRRQNVPEDTQELPPEVLEATIEALKKQLRWRPLLAGEHFKKEKRPTGASELCWGKRVSKLGQLLIQKSWEERVRRPNGGKLKANAGKKPQEEQSSRALQTINNQDKSDYCQPPVSTTSRQASNAPSLPQPMSVAGVPRGTGPANHSSLAPFIDSGNEEQTERANQHIALSRAGCYPRAQPQFATFCGYLQIWEFQTKSRLTVFSMNRFEDPGRILGPFILVHIEHVTYDKLQLFVMQDATTKIDIIGFMLEYNNGSMTFVRNTQELRDILLSQTMHQLGRIAELNLTVYLRNGPAANNPAGTTFQNQPPSNTQAGAQQLALQHSQLPTLGQEQQMGSEFQATSLPPTPTLRTQHGDPRRHSAQRYHPYGQEQRDRASASALSRPPIYAPPVAMMRAPPSQGNGQIPIDSMLPFTATGRGKTIDLTGGDEAESGLLNHHERGSQAQASRAFHQQAQAQAHPGAQQAAPPHPQSQYTQSTQTTTITTSNSIVHDLVRGNMQPVQNLQPVRNPQPIQNPQPVQNPQSVQSPQPEHAQALLSLGASVAPTVEATEAPTTSRPEMPYSDDEMSEDEAADGFTAEAFFAAQRATGGSRTDSEANGKSAEAFGKAARASKMGAGAAGRKTDASSKKPQVSEHAGAGTGSGSNTET